jgi:hypothetical protein
MKFRTLAAATAALSLTVAPVAAQAAAQRTAAPVEESSDLRGGSWLIAILAIAAIIAGIIIATKNHNNPVSP